jgi:hypothetical protein
MQTCGTPRVVDGLRRLIDPWRVRETLILPLRRDSLEDVDGWLAVYDDESS